MGTDIDHIDPTWEEGRDYQLVCGLDIALNYRDRDAGLNRKKQNMFLPYRGAAPVEDGEVCWFLDPDTNEWSRQAFLGEWWFEKAKATAARHNISVEGRAAISVSCSRPKTPDHRRKIGEANSRALKGKPWSAARRAAQEKRKFTSEK